MKSVLVNADKSLQIVDVPMPQIDSTSVLVKTLACGICNGTDTKIIHGAFKNVDQYPTLLGHEAVGEVVEVGKDVTNFKVGDRVLSPIIEGGLGDYSSAWGSFSEYSVCRDWQAMARNGIGPGTPSFADGIYTQKKIPADFDPVSSVMIITLREVLSAAYVFGFRANESIVIHGAGPVGLSFIKFAKLLGMGPVICFEVVEDKLAAAAEAGADYCFNSKEVDMTAEVRRLCPNGVDYSLDAVGINGLISSGMKLIRDGGKLLTYGISPKLDMNLDWADAPYNWSLQFYQMPIKKAEAAAHEQLISWIRMGVVNPMDYISHVLPFQDVLKGFEMVEARQVPIKKIVIKYY